MGVQNTSTGSGKTAPPPAASWEGAATAAQGAQAAAPAAAPAKTGGVTNYRYTYADGSTGNSPFQRDANGNYMQGADGRYNAGTFGGRTMPDGTVINSTPTSMLLTGATSVNQNQGWNEPARQPVADPDGLMVGGAAPGAAGGGMAGNGNGNGNGKGSFGGGGFGTSPVQGPVNDTSRQRVEQAILARLEPQFRQDEAAMQNKLLSAGLEVGSPAYNSELRRLQQGQNDARQQAILSGGTEESRQVGLNAALQGQGFSQGLQGAQFDNATRQQMLSELLLRRNTSLNELNSLRTGSQVAMPNFQGYYTNNAAAAPMFDAAQAQGNYDMAAAQNSQSGFNSMLGGLASLGGAGIMKYSDARLKANITPLGRTPGGFPVYSWDWKDGSGRDVGVIAQEVQSLYPEAVARDASGYLMVDYSKIR